MNKTMTHQAGCFCGAVQFTLSGDPEAMAYCHCDSCRHWSAGPVSAFTLWPTGRVQISRGAENIAMFDGNPGSGDETVVSERKWCSKCGGHLFTSHPVMGLIDVPAVVIEDFAFNPEFHVHYQESVHPIADGLTKFRDLPEAAGGSGDTLSE